MPDTTKLPPPGGDQQRAETYIKQLVQLMTDGKLLATHTDLTKFDPNALQDHYRIDIKNYQLEISHSKQPTTGKDIYVLLFINSPSVDDFYNAQGIIAYLVLNDEQFKRFKAIADEQIETRRKVEEEKRFAKAVKPIEELLEKIAKGETTADKPVEVAKEIIKEVSAPKEDDKKSSVKQEEPVKLEAGKKPEPETVKEIPQPAPLPPAEPVPQFQPAPIPTPEPEPQKTNPTLQDVQEAIQQTAQEPNSPTEIEKQEPQVNQADHNLDIPQVVTLPSTEPETIAPETSAPVISQPPILAPTPDPLPLPTPEPTPPPPDPTPPTPEPEPVVEQTSPSAATPAPEPQQSIMGMPLGNVLTESLPTGSQAPPPSGIDQAIDQAFQSSSNNTISSQTPPIGI